MRRRDEASTTLNQSLVSFRVLMGRRPTHRNESQDVTPAKAGVHVREELDSRFRGNDVTFNGAQREISLWFPLSRLGPERDSSLRSE